MFVLLALLACTSEYGLESTVADVDVDVERPEVPPTRDAPVWRDVDPVRDPGGAVRIVERPETGERVDTFRLGGGAPTPIVDVLLVVDNSISMNSEQAAVAAAGTQFTALLNNATVDWRAAVVTSGFYSPGGQAEGCTNTACGETTKNQCRVFTRDTSVLSARFLEG